MKTVFAAAALSLIASSDATFNTSTTPDTVDLSVDERDIFSRYIGFANWIYTTAGNRTEPVPFNYTSVAFGDRWAILKPEQEGSLSRDNCVIVHRGTFDEEEAQDDFASQFADPIDINGVQVNEAFWNSYARFRDEQNEALEAAVEAGNCTRIDLTGHSLGGATTYMALADLAKNYSIYDVVPSAPPRAIIDQDNGNGANCDVAIQLPENRVVRFNRAAQNYTTNSSFTHDPVGAVPWTPDIPGKPRWSHCAALHVAVVSEGQYGPLDSFALVEQIANFPYSYIGQIDDFLAWLRGPSAVWHDPTRYAAGIAVNKDSFQQPPVETDPPSSATRHLISLLPALVALISIF